MFDNLTTKDSVLYVINSRNSIVTSSNRWLAGAYFMRYEDIPDRLYNKPTDNQLQQDDGANRSTDGGTAGDGR